MCEVNVVKFNPKPHFGDVKVGDMFQDMSDYWYMKVKINQDEIWDDLGPSWAHFFVSKVS